MQTAALAARRVAGRRTPAIARLQARSYATPVSYAKEDEDPQLADYPRLSAVSKQTRPARGWEDMQMRRNFGEPLHEKEEALSMWGPDTPVVPPATALRQFSIAVLGFVTFGFIVKFALVPDRPSIAREYPFDGLVKEFGGVEENKARPDQATEVDEE